MDSQMLMILAYVICVIGAAITFSAKFMVKSAKPEVVVKDGNADESEIKTAEEIDQQELIYTKKLLTIKAIGLWILIVGVIILFFVNR